MSTTIGSTSWASRDDLCRLPCCTLGTSSGLTSGTSIFRCISCIRRSLTSLGRSSCLCGSTRPGGLTRYRTNRVCRVQIELPQTPKGEGLLLASAEDIRHLTWSVTTCCIICSSHILNGIAIVEQDALVDA